MNYILLSTPGQGRAGGFKWSGCIVRIRLWLHLPHSCHRLLSITSVFGASPGAIGLCIPALASRCSLALRTLQGYAYIQVRGHSLPVVLPLAPSGPSWLGYILGLRLKNPMGSGPVKVKGSVHI